MPTVDFTPVDNAIRRMDFVSSRPCLRRAKARFKETGDLEAFEREVEQALSTPELCTVCGRSSTAQDGRCKDHISTKLAGDWPTEGDLRIIKRNKTI